MSTTDNRRQASRDEILRDVECKAEQERLAKSDHFSSLYSEWLGCRSKLSAHLDDDTARILGDREDDLARLITTTPAVSSWQVLRKVAVLEHYLSGGETWDDNRLIVYLAGIKADLLNRL